MAARRSGTSWHHRLLALAICAACIAAIVRLAGAPDAPPAITATATADADCAARKRAEIDQERSAGRLTAEQAMIRRQKIAAECG
jgi:hypothetical protein